MKLEHYSPTFRNVLLAENKKQEKTSGGIYIPEVVLAQSLPDETTYSVVKVGKDCTTVQPGDIVYLSRGIFPEPLGEYFSVMEQQIKGFERTKTQLDLFNNECISDAPGSQSKTSRSS